MIQQPEDIKILHKRFMKIWESGLTVDETFSKFSDEAGVEWITDRQNNKIPDSKGKYGSWKTINPEFFCIGKWCIGSLDCCLADRRSTGASNR